MPTLSITATTTDTYLPLDLEMSETPFYQGSQRVTAIKTLDGDVTFIHGGVTIKDQSRTFNLKNLTSENMTALRSLFLRKTELIFTFREGVFTCKPNTFNQNSNDTATITVFINTQDA